MVIGSDAEDYKRKFDNFMLMPTSRESLEELIQKSRFKEVKNSLIIIEEKDLPLTIIKPFDAKKFAPDLDLSKDVKIL